ncbi:uncharacterized protein LOC135431149 [Drosophila montana]|uniref:uncharacterized protein LOC135431149 n=1 Tax=Drosophila montana TaxID=40370 RepID=UPI00313BD398
MLDSHIIKRLFANNLFKILQLNNKILGIDSQILCSLEDINANQGGSKINFKTKILAWINLYNFVTLNLQLNETIDSFDLLKDSRTLIHSKDFYESNEANPSRIGRILSLI